MEVIDTKNKIKIKKLKKIKWNHEEENIIQRKKLLKHLFWSKCITVSLILDIKLRKSCFGRFLRCYNLNQQNNKEILRDKIDFELLAIKTQTEQDKIDWNYYHNFTEDCFGILTAALKQNEDFDLDYLYNNLLILRLKDCHINVVDNVLKKYRVLKLLSLSGNWITSIDGSNLPPNLRFLDLYCNEIEDVTNLSKDGPKNLMHLCLGRNSISESANLKDLTAFQHLRTLELGDNDLCQLGGVLTAIKALHLTALTLEGNPCALCKAYKVATLSAFPRLLFLDNVHVEPTDLYDAKHWDQISGLSTCAVTFHCFRVIGIPKPRKDKKSDQKYYVEVSLPLLNAEEDNESEQFKSEKTQISPPIMKDKAKGKDKKKSQKATPKIFNEIKGSFKSEQIPWAKILTFPNPAIFVSPFDNDLRSVRDTFKSCVKVRIVYIKIAKPAKKQKQNKGPKNKKDSKNFLQEPKIEPKEQILNQEEILSFTCELYQINWSDQTIDFYWNGDPKHGSFAVSVDGSLRDIVYQDKKNKAKKQKNQKGSEKENEIPDPFAPQPLPKVLTCQVGFGVQRLCETS